MITSERTQNVIVTFVIIVALVSSVFLVNNAQYYGGSYILAETLGVDLMETKVSDINHENDSIYPALFFTFNFQTNTRLTGNVRLKFIGLVVALNDQSLTYTTFTQIIPDEYEQLHPGYDRNFTLGRTTSEDQDRNIILQADNSSSWNWFLIFRYYYITFDISESITWRYLDYNFTGSTIFA